MSCPICDNKAANCDCSPEEIRLHEEVEQKSGYISELSDALEVTREERDAANLQNQELQKAARALLDKLHSSWVGKDYAEYAFSEDAKSHPMADLEKLLAEKPKCVKCNDTQRVKVTGGLGFVVCGDCGDCGDRCPKCGQPIDNVIHFCQGEKKLNEQCWCAAKAETRDAVCPLHG